MPGLSLFLFGAPRLEQDGTPLKIDRRKALALLAYLAVGAELRSRDALATMLWPNSDQGRARAALRRVLVTLNQAIGKDYLEADREIIGLVPKAARQLWLDVTQFRRWLAEYRACGHLVDGVCQTCLPLLKEAVALYRDDFMAGFTLPDCPDFDEWQFFQGERLRQQLAWSLDRLIQGHLGRGDFETALAYSRRRLELDPLHEPAHQQLMQLYVWTGRPAAALTQYRHCVERLAEAFDTTPSTETQTLYRQIKRQEMPSPPEVRPACQPVPSTQPPAPHLRGLPLQATTFIGRETELAQISRLLLEEPACRLLALVGPGGIGKTRLALRAAQELGPAFPHGAHFIPLTAVNAARFIVSTIADVLNFSFYSGAAPREQLLGYLQEKKLLLILDNFEPHLGSIDLLTDILGRAAAIKILVTSRVRLNLQEEWRIPLLGLPVPDVDQIEMADRFAAVQLFVQRARQVQPGFSVTPDAAPAVIRICRLVEGLPLGIELATAWLGLLSCEEIAQEIERSLDFLTTPLQNVPERHRSLRAVFEHSWQLLSETEREAFMKLSLFRGGFQREAAEQVAGASLPLLMTLADKSLLHRTRSGRYAIHELLRQYATEKLEAAPKPYRQVKERHRRYYLTFLSGRRVDLKGGRQREALTEIARDIDNIREAWRRTVAQGDLSAIDQAAESLWLFCAMWNWFQDGEAAFKLATDRLARLLEADQAAAASPLQIKSLLGYLLAGQGWFCHRLGQVETGQVLLERSRALLRPIYDQAPGQLWRSLAFSLYLSGVTLYLQGDFEAAGRYQQESLELYQTREEGWGMGVSLTAMGLMAEERGEFARAKQLQQESIAQFKALGERRFMAFALASLGRVAQALGEYEQAERLLQESLELRRAVDDTGSSGFSLAALAVCRREPKKGLTIAKMV